MKTQTVRYSPEEFQKSYNAWISTHAGANGLMHMNERQAAWDNYCDHRDGLPKGTTTRLMEELRKKETIKFRTDLN